VQAKPAASSFRVSKKRRVAALENAFSYPVVTAASAIQQALDFLGAKTVALACPYPQWLYELALGFWKQRGFRVQAAVSVQPRMGDTRAIYEVSGAAAGRELIETFEGVDADAFVITGTGMPGLQAVVDLQEATGKPVVNSNLCLAWACLNAAGVPLNERSPAPGYPLLGGWKDGVRGL